MLTPKAPKSPVAKDICDELELAIQAEEEEKLEAEMAADKDLSNETKAEKRKELLKGKPSALKPKPAAKPVKPAAKPVK